MKKIKSFFLNGSILTICAVLIRAVAVSFNVYIAGAAGAEAVGLYSLLSGIYGFGVTLALSGLNLAVTRLISEHLALNDMIAVKKTMVKCFSLAFFFGTAASILILTLATPLSTGWLNEIRVLKPLKLLSLCLPMIAISSVINGYFTAVRRGFKNAISQLVEMSARISVTVILFYYAKGVSPERACIFLVCGSIAGEAVVFLANMILYICDRWIHFASISEKNTRAMKNVSVLNISLPVALTSYIRSALISIEHASIPKGLEKYGADRKGSLIAYGTLSGMALPVINFPYALIGSFSSLLIPEIAESRAKGKKKHIRYMTHRTYQYGIIFAVCISGIFFTFSNQLGQLLYSSEEASLYIRSLAPLVPIMYMDSITDAILKGMGEQVYAMKVNIADACISVILVYILVPIYGISGYIATIYIAEVINASLSIFRMLKVTEYRPKVLGIIVRPAACAIGAASICNIVFHIFMNSVGVYELLLLLLLYLAAYIFLISCLGGLNKKDAEWIGSIFSKKL